MRFDTVKISAYLVYMIQGQRPRLEVLVDGGDILHVRVSDGSEIMIYLIESDITDYEIKNIVNENSARRVYSLFILWCDLLLPRDGMYYIPDDWMRILLAMHSDKIYAFDAYDAEAFIFPIFFDGTGTARDIRHGGAIDVQYLNVKRIKTPFSPDEWYVANFDIAAAPSTPLAPYFDLLGINPTTDRALIKRAYRSAARRFHPDLNDTDEAHLRMQQINDAYARILRVLEDEEKPI